MNNIQRFLESVGLQLQEDDKLTNACETENLRVIEDYIVLCEKGKTYYIYEVHRAERIMKKQDQDKERAVIWAVILYKRMNDNTADRIMTRKIRSMITDGDEASVKELFREFNEDIFSIGKETEDKLCLIEENGQASVVYNGTAIVTAVSLSRAYIVLYNYCRKMQEILSFYREQCVLMNEKEVTQQEAVRLYMGI